MIGWFSIQECASTVGLSMAGFQLGNVVSLLLTPATISSLGISGPFVLFSSLGLLWLSPWIYAVTDDPGESPFVSKYEVQLIREGKVDFAATGDKRLLAGTANSAGIFAAITGTASAGCSCSGWDLFRSSRR
ncbi:hypothetical protein Nepgr_024887 [Nepenthes gracilis]|uniref:Major facilitator superfamily (MFS) profile domain-containing protein n=1 Tax=Nepenthes gracilis TaxID=150966 RepID=A0AAD3T5Y0_NEPGR|nr:hypothetical protein Nepgr_024887 [Nepenthes gracilis]